MFLRVEGERLINLTLISRLDFHHHEKEASLWNAGVLELRSKIAYDYFMAEENASFLYVKNQ